MVFGPEDTFLEGNNSFGLALAMNVPLLYFLAQERSGVAFPVQIRLVYFVFTLFGLWPEVRLPIYLVLLVGTFMVTFFGRCAIGLALKQMPWNRGRELRLN